MDRQGNHEQDKRQKTTDYGYRGGAFFPLWFQQDLA